MKLSNTNRIINLRLILSNFIRLFTSRGEDLRYTDLNAILHNRCWLNSLSFVSSLMGEQEMEKTVVSIYSSLAALFFFQGKLKLWKKRPVALKMERVRHWVSWTAWENWAAPALLEQILPIMPLISQFSAWSNPIASTCLHMNQVKETNGLSCLHGFN